MPLIVRGPRPAARSLESRNPTATRKDCPFARRTLGRKGDGLRAAEPGEKKELAGEG